MQEIRVHSKKYGWRPDKPDHRDLTFKLVRKLGVLPSKVDLRPGMPPVYDQGDLGSCHDASTEILTSAGWLPFPELTLDHKLATVDPETSVLSFEFPVRVIRLPYQGLMVVGSSQSLDFKVTPEHQMLVRKWNESARTLEENYQFTSAQTLGWYAGLMSRVSWAGDQDRDFFELPGIPHKHKPQRSSRRIPMDLWLMFLGIYLAEGTILEHKTHPHYKIQIAGSKEREKSFIRFVLDSLGAHYLELSDRFTFENKQIYRAMEGLGLRGVKAPCKFVPEFVFHLSGNHIKALLLGHFMGDGSEQDGLKTHHTSSPKLARDLQRLMFLAGYSTGMSERPPRSSVMLDGRKVTGHHPEYSVRQRNTTNLSIDRSACISRDFYDGVVYCAEVPTHHTLVTRRNGKILISGNCTANALAACFEYAQMKQKVPYWTPSRLMIYYLERFLEHTIKEDAGAEIRDGAKVLARYGVCSEGVWPYDVNKFAVKPPKGAFKLATQSQALRYARLQQTESDVCQTLAQGFPIAFGFMVYEEIDLPIVAQHGDLPMPGKHSKSEGGHAVTLVGYDLTTRKFLVRNSWGTGWGIGGHFWMPFDYVLNSNLSDDFWVLYSVEDGDTVDGE